MDSNYDSRTSLTYLTEKVRQNDAANAVTIRSVGDSPALVLSQQAGERIYETWILRATTAICGKFLWRRVYR